ncbi:hypothetical protein [Comamonas terrigena]|uniref:hypothetical protein n=1 Tax=Comamonas terrigena TaxID=32013 RepID=UPI00289B93CC|nr:hypothetical protein [Comamonas terrigena]
MATIKSVRESLSKSIKFHQALATARRMRDLLGSKGALFMTFALTALHGLKADKALDASEFAQRIDAEVEKLYARYITYQRSAA